MGANQKMLDAVKWMSGTGGMIGLFLVILSMIVSDYNKDYFITAVGMGIILSSVAIFIMGTLFTLTEEMVMNTEKGELVIPETNKVVNLKNRKKAKTKRASI